MTKQLSTQSKIIHDLAMHAAHSAIGHVIEHVERSGLNMVDQNAMIGEIYGIFDANRRALEWKDDQHHGDGRMARLIKQVSDAVFEEFKSREQ